MKYCRFLLLGFSCAAFTWGQATVENAVGAGAATGAAAGAKGAGQAVGGVFGAVGNILNRASKPADAGNPGNSVNSTATVVTAPSENKAVSVPSKPVDPAEIKSGMTRDELLNRFGEPATRTSQFRQSKMVDTFWYATANKDELIVSLTDGKVVSAVLASQRNKRAAAPARR
jgi:hypothetical protein